MELRGRDEKGGGRVGKEGVEEGKGERREGECKGRGREEKGGEWKGRKGWRKGRVEE